MRRGGAAVNKMCLRIVRLAEGPRDSFLLRYIVSVMYMYLYVSLSVSVCIYTYTYVHTRKTCVPCIHIINTTCVCSQWKRLSSCSSLILMSFESYKSHHVKRLEGSKRLTTLEIMNLAYFNRSEHNISENKIEIREYFYI